MEFIEHDDQFSDQEKKQSSEIKKSCNLNLAAVHLKLHDSKEACRACNKVHTALLLNKRLSQGISVPY